MNSLVVPAQDIKSAAISVGFHACGVAAVHRLDSLVRRYSPWLSRHGHADMQYMEQHIDKRMDPAQLLPGAKSVVSVLLGYKPTQVMKGSPRIAQYAYGPDYHERVKSMLFQLIALVKDNYPDFEAKPCVDTVPISDKLWAHAAGLGWIGRNTLLVNPNLGSYCYIGELVTTAIMDKYDNPMPSRCGSCRLCVDCCPNNALVSCPESSSDDDSPTELLASRCSSYNTVENRSETLPPSLRLAGYAFGCDCCQLCCPFNQNARSLLEVDDERIRQLELLSSADEASFRRATRHSAINRIKFPQWQRNLNH